MSSAVKVKALCYKCKYSTASYEECVECELTFHPSCKKYHIASKSCNLRKGNIVCARGEIEAMANVNGDTLQGTDPSVLFDSSRLDEIHNDTTNLKLQSELILSEFNAFKIENATLKRQNENLAAEVIALKEQNTEILKLLKSLVRP